MFNKLNLKTDDRVELHNLTGDLDGQRGDIVGKAVIGPIDFYIVMLDNSYTDEDDFIHMAVSIPEVCLKRVG